MNTTCKLCQEKTPLVATDAIRSHIDLQHPERGVRLCASAHDLSRCPRCLRGETLVTDGRGELLHRTAAMDFECPALASFSPEAIIEPETAPETIDAEGMADIPAPISKSADKRQRIQKEARDKR